MAASTTRTIRTPFDADALCKLLHARPMPYTVTIKQEQN